MTIRTVAGLSRIGLQTADGCFFPLMLENFRGVRELVLTTTNSKQQAAEVDLFLEEPGGGEHCQHLGTVHLDETAVVGGRPDLILRVRLDPSQVLTAVLTGPAGRGELRVAVQRYSSGDVRMRSAPKLPSTLEAVTAGLLDGEPHASKAPPAASWRASGGRADDDQVISLPQFVHRSTSTIPVNTRPYDPARILWLAERADLSWAEAELIRSVCRRLADDPDPARADVARTATHLLEERAAERHDEQNTANLDNNDPPSGEAFLRRDYSQVLRLLHTARQTGAASGVLAELANYWLEK